MLRVNESSKYRQSGTHRAFSNMNGHPPRAHRSSRNSSPASPSDHTTLNPFLWPQGGEDARKCEAGHLSCCAEALATVPVHLHSHICLPHLHPSSLPVDRTRELFLSVGGLQGQGSWQYSLEFTNHFLAY